MKKECFILFGLTIALLLFPEVKAEEENVFPYEKAIIIATSGLQFGDEIFVPQDKTLRVDLFCTPDIDGYEIEKRSLVTEKRTLSEGKIISYCGFQITSKELESFGGRMEIFLRGYDTTSFFDNTKKKEKVAEEYFLVTLGEKDPSKLQKTWTGKIVFEENTPFMLVTNEKGDFLKSAGEFFKKPLKTISDWKKVFQNSKQISIEIKGKIAPQKDLESLKDPLLNDIDKRLLGVWETFTISTYDEKNNVWEIAPPENLSSVEKIEFRPDKTLCLIEHDRMFCLSNPLPFTIENNMIHIVNLESPDEKIWIKWTFNKNSLELVLGKFKNNNVWTPFLKQDLKRSPEGFVSVLDTTILQKVENTDFWLTKTEQEPNFSSLEEAEKILQKPLMKIFTEGVELGDEIFVPENIPILIEAACFPGVDQHIVQIQSLSNKKKKTFKKAGWTADCSILMTPEMTKNFGSSMRVTWALSSENFQKGIIQGFLVEIEKSQKLVQGYLTINREKRESKEYEEKTWIGKIKLEGEKVVFREKNKKRGSVLKTHRDWQMAFDYASDLTMKVSAKLPEALSDLPFQDENKKDEALKNALLGFWKLKEAFNFERESEKDEGKWVEETEKKSFLFQIQEGMICRSSITFGPFVCEEKFLYFLENSSLFQSPYQVEVSEDKKVKMSARTQIVIDGNTLLLIDQWYDPYTKWNNRSKGILERVSYP